jgi:predicted CoA-binding protein
MGPGPGPASRVDLNTALDAEQRERYQDAEVIRRLLETARTIAIVGLSADKWKASFFVASYLQYEGYQIIPVNPRGGVILGETVYPDLLSVPVPIDIVEVFRPVGEIPAITDQAIAVGARALWLQLKLLDFESAERALAAGLSVVMDKCVKMEHGRFGGSLHWAGMNTEIVSARKSRWRR